MKKLIIGTAAVVILVIVGFFIFNSIGGTGRAVTTSNIISNDKPSDDKISDQVKIINIDAKKFEYSPNIIKLKKGDHVKIVVNNKDADHGIVIPDFNVKGMDSVEFTADKTGTFEFHCPTFCGEGHREMEGTIVVEE